MKLTRIPQKTALFLLFWSITTFGHDPIAAGMATTPRRVHLLPQVVQTIIDQVDVLYVYLNGHTSVPACLKHEKIVPFLSSKAHGDLGDIGKFYMASHHQGYFFTTDDDLLYPTDYVQKMIAAVESYKRKAIISAHGTLVPDTITNYWKGRKWISGFQESLDQDQQIHIAGTGVACFHTEYIRLTPSDFPVKNMCDVWLALKAQKEAIPMICLAKPANWIRETSDVRNPQCISLQRRNNCLLETKLAQLFVPWKFPKLASA